MEFDERREIAKKLKKHEELYPIRVEVNLARDEMIVVTRKDLKFYDIGNGKVKFI